MRPKTSEVLRRVLLKYYAGEIQGICLSFVDTCMKYTGEFHRFEYKNFFSIIRLRIGIAERTDLIWPQTEKYRHHRIRFVNLLIHHFESIGD